jgi:hypothetical protein
MIIERTIVGLATCFNQPPQGGRPWHAENFRDFLDDRYPSAVPLRVDHGPLVSRRGVIANIGVAHTFAAVTVPVPGLLCLAEVEEAGGLGDWLLHDIDLMLQQRWLPAGWGMSLGANQLDDIVIPFEVSMTRSLAFEDALVWPPGRAR